MTMEAELRALRDELSNRSNLASNQRMKDEKDENTIEDQIDKKINTMLEDQTTSDHHGSTDLKTEPVRFKKMSSEKIIENNDNNTNLNQSNIKDSQDELSNT